MGRQTLFVILCCNAHKAIVQVDRQKASSQFRHYKVAGSSLIDA